MTELEIEEAEHTQNVGMKEEWVDTWTKEWRDLSNTESKIRPTPH